MSEKPSVEIKPIDGDMVLVTMPYKKLIELAEKSHPFAVEMLKTLVIPPEDLSKNPDNYVSGTSKEYKLRYYANWIIKNYPMYAGVEKITAIRGIREKIISPAVDPEDRLFVVTSTDYEYGAVSLQSIAGAKYFVENIQRFLEPQ